MAYVKHRAIHTTPREHLKYILNPDKNEDMKYSTAICCTNDYAAVCEDFKEVYEAFAENKFDNYEKRKNESVRIHSYIQSFDETVSPETAHRIGVELAKRVFGENRPVIISTHVNTAHVHNHFAVCPYDLDGIHWYANKKTLEFVRKCSDEICLEHGLDIIKPPNKRCGMSYKEWDARKKGYSWKEKMADIIDRLIVRDDVTDIASLIEKMRECGYIFTNEKRLIAKPEKVKYGCSVAKLGYGYSAEMLMQRILNKQNEFAGKKISAFIGIQVEYAVDIRERQIEVYRSRAKYGCSYYELNKTAELFCFVCNNHIHSLDDMRKLLAAADKKENVLVNKYFRTANKKEQLKVLDWLGDEYARLLKTENRSEKQQKRLEDLNWRLMQSGAICGVDTHSHDWLPDLKNKLKRDLKELDGIAAELSKAGKERLKAEQALSDLERILETDYDRIRKREQLRIQIEKYHEGLEPQEDGTFKAEETPTAQRNAELAYLARLEEKRLRGEEKRRIFTERQAKEKRRERDYYSR